MTFWQFVGGIVTPISVTGEALIFNMGLPWYYHLAIVVAIGVMAYIKYHIKDDNNNGVVDRWE